MKISDTIDRLPADHVYTYSDFNVDVNMKNGVVKALDRNTNKYRRIIKRGFDKLSIICSAICENIGTDKLLIDKIATSINSVIKYNIFISFAVLPKKKMEN